jgi:hypothetical protein
LFCVLRVLCVGRFGVLPTVTAWLKAQPARRSSQAATS